jgi:hypothetical protein
MSGAQDAKPQVIVNIGYDPLEQMREVLQKEIIDIENKAEADDDSDNDLVDTFD